MALQSIAKIVKDRTVGGDKLLGLVMLDKDAIGERLGDEGKNHSKTLGEDPFEGFIEDILEPRFDPFFLARAVEFSSALAASIEAMEINIEGFGWRLAPLIDPEDKSIDRFTRKAIVQGKVKLENRLKIRGPNNKRVEHQTTSRAKKKLRSLEVSARKLLKA